MKVRAVRFSRSYNVELIAETVEDASLLVDMGLNNVPHCNEPVRAFTEYVSEASGKRQSGIRLNIWIGRRAGASSEIKRVRPPHGKRA